MPVIRNADDLNLLGLARQIDDAGTQARHGSVSVEDVSGGTFTLTNSGSRGALFDTPVVAPGQVATLGVGAVVERPVVVVDPNGERAIAIRSIAYLALSYDHRIVDSADAARFLTFVKQRLESGRLDAELR